MKYCPRCCSELEDSAKYCHHCGAKVPRGGHYLTPAEEEFRENNKIKRGQVVLSFLFPIVGVYLFFAQRRDMPRRAKANITAAAISFVLLLIWTYS